MLMKRLLSVALAVSSLAAVSAARAEGAGPQSAARNQRPACACPHHGSRADRPVAKSTAAVANPEPVFPDTLRLGDR